MDETETPRPNWFVRYCYRPKLLLLLALIPLAVVVVPQIKKLLPEMSTIQVYHVKTTSIQINPTPRWVPENLVEQVIQKAGLPETLSLLDDQLTVEIAAAFEQHPWVEKVIEVQKRSPAGISVELKYRKPVAMIDVKQGVYPVSANGILLPPSDFSRADTERYPLVINVQTVPQGGAGEPWGDVTVLGAATLAKELQDSWKGLHLAAIEVPTRTKANEKLEELSFRLITVGGSEIVWGQTAGITGSRQISTKQKIERLRSYQNKFGPFDRPLGPYEIDIRYHQKMTRIPLDETGNSIQRQ